MKKISVGLVVITDVPVMGRVAVLQVRGEFNHEKMGPESFPGACQITAHGKANDGETDPNAILLREICEELGPEARVAVSAKIAQGKLVELNRKDQPEKLVVNYGVVLPPDFLKTLSLTASTGGIRLVQTNQASGIMDLKQFDKIAGVESRRTIAMFDDEIAAVKLAFQKCI